MQKKGIRGLFFLGAFFLSYLLVRYGLFFLHGMKDWPLVLGFFGFLCLLLALYKDKKKMQLLCLVGYSLSFFLAKLFSSTSYDQGGGRLDNTWIIWTVLYFCFCLMGYFCKDKKETRDEK
ncbi:MAG TPA: hypothetical protein VFD08_03460 [Clostridia bacterium]|nr:hypothetical protein [Clostridia bacterium]